MNAVTARFERHSLTSSTPDYLWRASRALSVVNAPNVKTAVDELITEFEALEDTEIFKPHITALENRYHAKVDAVQAVENPETEK